MKGETDKCHLQWSKINKSSETHIGESIIKGSDCEKLLFIKIDPKLW